jgi:hypothetical protein
MKYFAKLLTERTTYDGLIIIGVCLAVVTFGGLAKMAAWAGLAYGCWTLLKSEG